MSTASTRGFGSCGTRFCHFFHRSCGTKGLCCMSPKTSGVSGSDDHDGQEQEPGQDRSVDKQEGNFVLVLVARIFSRRPFLILFLTLTLAIVLTKFGLSEFGFPEFEDPYLGFETRFTPISNRLIALENLRKEVNKLGILENYPGEKLTGREWRRKRESLEEFSADEVSIMDEEESYGGYCTQLPLDDYSRIALELKPSKSIFSHEVLMLICYFQKLTEVLLEYTRVCEHDGEGECCPMWSLPNYIASHSNKTDCSNIKEDDSQLFKLDMQHCYELFQDPSKFEACTLKHDLCPLKCHRDGPIYSSMFLTVDKGFTNHEDIQFTMIILPIPKHRGSRSRTASLQSALTQIQLPENAVSLAGYDFGDKDWIFKLYLLTDLKYVLIGSIVIFMIVCCYTKSISVTLISFLVLILSLGVSYFFYTMIFQIPYFPFMNMLVTIIVMGIGTDGTLILGSEWHRLKLKHKDPDQKTRDEMMLTLLCETTAPLFVTTCTTAGAFFASLTSSITTIRCFSIFAGTSILVGFILLYLCVPTTLLLSDLCLTYIRTLFLNTSSQNGRISSKLIKIFSSFKQISNIRPPDKCLKTLRNHTTLLWSLSFSLLFGILCWSCLIVFYSPGFQLPNSEQFQLLSTDHPIERFDREIEPRFPGSLSNNGFVNEEKLTVYLIWGIKAQDNGYGLDPNDNGALEFDPNFSMVNPKSQKWMRKLCSKLRKQSFYDEVSNTVVGAHYDSCFMDTMVKWMKRDCEHVFFKNVTYKPCCKMSKFPYEPEVFTKCVEVAARDLYRTPSLYFQPDIAGPKFFIFKGDNSNSTNSGQLATFSLRVRTNVSFSLSYEKMQSFYNELGAFFDDEVLKGDKVPRGLENGFFISAHLDFFDLQTSLLNDTWMSVLISAGLCFLFLWIFSRSFLIAVGAVLCIFAIVIVSSAVLIEGFGWKLGVFESIAVTVAVGLSDFTAHHALEYSRRQSVLKMTSPTFFSATTTITIGLSMLLFSNVLVYQQIGAFFTVLIIVSWLYSVFFLSPILDLFDMLCDLCTSVSRLYFLDTNVNIPSRRHSDGNNAVVFSNPLASNCSRRNSEEILDNENLRLVLNRDGDSRCATLDKSKSKSRLDSLEESGENSESGGRPQRAIIEKVKLLKKVAAETSV